MPVGLPLTPAPRAAKPRLISFGGDLTPSLGGPTQRVRRIGSRYAIDVDLPPMLAEDARPWIARLARCENDTAILRFPQPGLEIGAPGSDVKVYGGGQAGSRLAVHQMSPGYTVREAQFFHLFHNGRHYLHQVTAAAVVAGNGRAILDIAPMLRIEPADGGHVNFLDVNIEGWIAGPETPWSLDLAGIYGLSFTLTEAE